MIHNTTTSWILQFLSEGGAIVLLNSSVTVQCCTFDLEIVGLNPGRVAIKWLLLK